MNCWMNIKDRETRYRWSERKKKEQQRQMWMFIRRCDFDSHINYGSNVPREYSTYTLMVMWRLSTWWLCCDLGNEANSTNSPLWIWLSLSCLPACLLIQFKQVQCMHAERHDSLVSTTNWNSHRIIVGLMVIFWK